MSTSTALPIPDTGCTQVQIARVHIYCRREVGGPELWQKYGTQLPQPLNTPCRQLSHSASSCSQLIGQYGGAAGGAAVVGSAVAWFNRRARGTGPWSMGQLGVVAVAAMVGGQMGAVYPTMLTSRSLLTVRDSELSRQARYLLRIGTQPYHESVRKRHGVALETFSCKGKSAQEFENGVHYGDNL